MVGVRWSALVVVMTVLAGCGGLGTRVASEAIPSHDHEAAGQKFGYITAVDAAKRTITFDPAEWLDREEAIAAGIIGPDEQLSNDYTISNPSRRTTVFKVAPNAEVTAAVPVSLLGVPPPARCAKKLCQSYPVTLEALFASFAPGECPCLYKFWLTIRNDVVVRLDEQYTP